MQLCPSGSGRSSQRARSLVQAKAHLLADIAEPWWDLAFPGPPDAVAGKPEGRSADE